MGYGGCVDPLRRAIDVQAAQVRQAGQRGQVPDLLPVFIAVVVAVIVADVQRAQLSQPGQGGQIAPR